METIIFYASFAFFYQCWLYQSCVFSVYIPKPLVFMIRQAFNHELSGFGYSDTWFSCYFWIAWSCCLILVYLILVLRVTKKLQTIIKVGRLVVFNLCGYVCSTGVDGCMIPLNRGVVLYFQRHENWSNWNPIEFCYVLFSNSV